MAVLAVSVMTVVSREFSFSLQKHEILKLTLPKNPEGDPFVSLKNCPRNVKSGISYFRNSLHPVCVKSGMGCVSVVKDPFTVQR